MNSTMEVPGAPGVWAVGDCAAIIDPTSNLPYPPTAQHALREGRRAGENIYARLQGKQAKPFLYKMRGQLATIGRRTGVARIFGLKFSGAVGWVLWRTVYLMMLPRLEKRLRVVLQWTLDVVSDVTSASTSPCGMLSRLIGCSKQEARRFRRSTATCWF